MELHTGLERTTRVTTSSPLKIGVFITTSPPSQPSQSSCVRAEGCPSSQAEVQFAISPKRLVANTPNIYTYTSMNCNIRITRNVRFPKFINVKKKIVSTSPITYRSVPLGLWFTSLLVLPPRETNEILTYSSNRSSTDIIRAYHPGTAAGHHIPNHYSACADHDERAALHFCIGRIKNHNPPNSPPSRGTALWKHIGHSQNSC